MNQYDNEFIDEHSDVWSDSELCRIFDWVNREWENRKLFNESMMVALAFCAGLRRMDMFGRPGHPEEGLTVKQCQTMPFPQIVLPHSKGPRRNGGQGKRRHVELIPEFATKFRQRLERYRIDGKVFVFQRYGVHDKGVSARHANELWNHAMELAGVRNYFLDENDNPVPMGIRAARRTFATYARLLTYEGEDGQRYRIRLEDLQAQLGHTDIKTTAMHYLRSLPGQRWAPRKVEWTKHI